MKEILYAVLLLGIMGAVFGAVLAIASKVFAVKTDERLPKLIEALRSHQYQRSDFCQRQHE